MAYSRNDAYKAMQKIYGLKQDWMNADAAGDEAKKNNAATKAQEYYRSLTDNGYGAQAQKLYDSGLDQSRKLIDDFYAASGRSAMRPYFHNKAKQYGLSQDDIDNALSFNEITGEVTFGGKNIGKPAAISSDGVSYWDSGDLDNIFNDYISSNGITKPMSTTAKQGTEDLMGMNKQLFDATMKDHETINNTNPANPLDEAMKSDAIKDILQQYGLAGYTGRQNALAKGAASNGGNVDSYSAANAMRQQAALRSMGAETAVKAALDAYNAKQSAYNDQQQHAATRLDQARATLQQMGVSVNDAVTNNETMLNGEVDRSETVKNGEVNRNETVLNGKMNRAVQEAGMTGYVPRYVANRNNRYFDENGNLKDPDGNNFADIVYALRGELENTTDENRRKQIEEQINEALEAGAYKVTLPQYSQYAAEWARQFPEAGSFIPQQTEDAKFSREQLASSEKMANANNQHETDMANLNAENQRKQTELEGNIAITQANNATDNVIRANAASTNDSIRASRETSQPSDNSNGGDGPISVSFPEGSTVEDWVKWLNSESQKEYEVDAVQQSTLGRYSPANGSSEWIVVKILQNQTLTPAQKEYLLQQLNISDAVVRTVRNDKHYN